MSVSVFSVKLKYEPSLAAPPLGPHQYGLRRPEHLARVERVGSARHVDAGEDLRRLPVPAAADAPRRGAGPLERDAEHLARLLVRLTERHHHPRVRLPCVASARLRRKLDDLSVRDLRLADVRLLSPFARQTQDPDFLRGKADRRGKAVRPNEPHGSAFGMTNLHPRLNSVAVVPTLDIARHLKGIELVHKTDRRDFRAALCPFLTARLLQPQRHRAVCVQHLKPGVLYDLLLSLRDKLSKREIPRKCNFNSVHPSPPLFVFLRKST